MRLPASAHASRPWLIHELAPDFRLEDVWALPTPGRREEFPRLVSLLSSTDPSHGSSPVVRALFELRWRLGRLLGWDRDAAAAPTVPERVPAELRRAAEARGTFTGRFAAQAGAIPLYLTDDEWAVEIVNRTVDGILHVGWVPDGDRYRGQMAILVKRKGLLGALYMAAITPFRHALVYPAMLKEIGRRWGAA